jgi:hypothetical protein
MFQYLRPPQPFVKKDEIPATTLEPLKESLFGLPELCTTVLLLFLTRRVTRLPLLVRFVHCTYLA